MMRVTLGKSRVRESCMPGSVRAKAEWLSYSTMTMAAAAALAGSEAQSREAIAATAESAVLVPPPKQRRQ